MDVVKGCAYRRRDGQCLCLEQIGLIMSILYEELPLALAHLVNRGARYLMLIMESCLQYRPPSDLYAPLCNLFLLNQHNASAVNAL